MGDRCRILVGIECLVYVVQADARRRHRFDNDKNAGDDVVAVIRDDGDADAEDLATRVADAPRNTAGRKVQTLQVRGLNGALVD